LKKLVDERAFSWILSGAAMLLMLSLPLFAPSSITGLVTEIFILALFAMSLGLIMGYAGLVSLGHAAFFGAGAYTVAILSQHVSNAYVLLASATLVAAGLAAVSGALFFRSAGAYFLMLTLAFAQVLSSAASQAPSSLTGGSDGLNVTVALNLGFGEINSQTGLYYTMGGAFLIGYVLLRLFVSSPAGMITRGIMDNELRMRALGYRTLDYKLFAYTLAGALAGFAGAMYTYFNLYVTPDFLGWIFSGEALIMVIVGGAGTLLGPALGAAFFTILQNYVSFYTDYWALVMGVVFVLFVLLGRGGIVHIFRSLWGMFFRTGPGGSAEPQNADDRTIPSARKGEMS